MKSSLMFVAFAAHADRSVFGPTLGKALRLAVFLTLPSAVGLYFLAQPIIAARARGLRQGADGELPPDPARRRRRAGVGRESCAAR